MSVKICARCGQNPPHARGLCNRCCYRSRLDGTLADYPRKTWARADLLDTYRTLRARLPRDATRAQIAAQIGVTVAALDQALHRARREERTSV